MRTGGLGHDPLFASEGNEPAQPSFSAFDTGAGGSARREGRIRDRRRKRGPMSRRDTRRSHEKGSGEASRGVCDAGSADGGCGSSVPLFQRKVSRRSGRVGGLLSVSLSGCRSERTVCGLCSQGAGGGNSCRADRSLARRRRLFEDSRAIVQRSFRAAYSQSGAALAIAGGLSLAPVSQA